MEIKENRREKNSPIQVKKYKALTEQIHHLGAATRNRGAKTEINGFGVTGHKPLAPPLVLADTSPIPISLPLLFPLPRAPRLYSCPPPPYLPHRLPPFALLPTPSSPSWA